MTARAVLPGSSIGTPPELWLDGAGAKADSGTTENAAAITTALKTTGLGTARLGYHGSSYVFKHPIVIPSGAHFCGSGQQGGSILQADASFPHTQINGAVTTPADNTTPFIVTVDSTTNFPMATGGITLTGGVGVICVQGITIYYTGITGTTFTGCKVGWSDVNVLLADNTPVSTFAIWMTEPGLGGAAAGYGAGTRIEDMFVDLNLVPGISGVIGNTNQEGSGCRHLLLWRFHNFGVRMDSEPANPGDEQPCNFWHDGLNLIFSNVADPNGVGLDIMLSREGHFEAQNAGTWRGVNDVTCTVYQNVNVVGKAGIRVNGTGGSITTVAAEKMHAGVLVGDVFPCNVTVQNVSAGSDWGSNPNDAVVVLGNTVGNVASVRKTWKTDWADVPNRKVLADLVNGVYNKDRVCDYDLFYDGSYRVNGGARLSTAANRPPLADTTRGAVHIADDTGLLSVGGTAGWFPFQPAPSYGIALVQDNVASGARDNSSSTTLTVTFTAATLAGNHCVMAALQSGTFVLTSVSDSRGNTWQVDVTKGTDGPSSNIASCHITTPHQIGDTLTLTFSGASTYSSAIVSHWANLASASWLDKTASQSPSSGDPISTGVTAARSQSNELLFGTVSFNNATDLTPVTGWTALAVKSSGAGLRKVAPIYRVVAAVGTDAAQWNNTPNTDADASIATFKGNAPVIQKNLLAAAIPVTGTFAIGDKVWFSAPTAGGSIGAVCVAAGTPGTWKSFGAIAA